MNINHMKGILGDAVSNEVRTLELRVGQVVRGVVLQQFANNEATVSINGVQVRAKLEVPIMEGQASLLQVQPDSKSGHIHLKQVDPTTLGLQDPMKDILKTLNLPDKAWANDLVKDLRKEGFALNKETAAAFQRAAQLQPAGVTQEQWMTAAATAFKRGLPMTEATIAAIHQLQSGTQAHSLIDQLRGQLQQALQGNLSQQSQALLSRVVALLNEGSGLLGQLSGQQATGSAGTQLQPAANPSIMATPQTNSQAQTAVSTQQQGTGFNQLQTQALQSTVSAQPAAAATANSNVNQAAATTSQPQPQAESVAANPSQQAAAQANQGASGQVTTAGTTNQTLLPQLLKWLGVNYEAALGKQLVQQDNASASQAAQSTGTGNMTQTSGQLTASAPGGSFITQSGVGQQTVQSTLISNTGNQVAAQLNSSPLVQPQTGANITYVQQAPAEQASVTNAQPQQAATVPQIAGQPNGPALAAANSQMPAMPADAAANAAGAQAGNANGSSAQAVMQQAALPADTSALHAQQQSQLAQAQPQTVNPSQQPNMQHIVQDNVKSALIQMLQQQDIPAQVKETAQQLVHAITGQQLMLSAERNHSVFSHITMFIPIKDASNGQTASVHIQTRRDRKGELDSENCRIVFDLQMNALGPTLVDMNIVNKIVSLNLWNDHPAAAPIVEAFKPEISEALYGLGYMMSSMRATPIPIKEEGANGQETNSQEEGKLVIIPPDIDQLNSARYKGVDFKI